MGAAATDLARASFDIDDDDDCFSREETPLLSQRSGAAFHPETTLWLRGNSGIDVFGGGGTARIDGDVTT